MFLFTRKCPRCGHKMWQQRHARRKLKKSGMKMKRTWVCRNMNCSGTR